MTPMIQPADIVVISKAMLDKVFDNPNWGMWDVCGAHLAGERRAIINMTWSLSGLDLSTYRYDPEDD